MEYIVLYNKLQSIIFNMEDPLGIPYAKLILVRLLEKGGKGKKSDIIMKDDSWTTWTKSLEKLSKIEYLTIEEKLEGRRTYEISLTDKGLQFAEELRSIDPASKGSLKKSFFSRSQLILMFLGRVRKATVLQIKDEIPGSYDDLKELEEMKLITQKIEETKGKKENYTTLTGKGEEMAKELEKCEDIVKR